MIVDFHTHIFPEKIAEKAINGLKSNSNNKNFSDGTADGLILAMERANADVSVALPVLTKASQFDGVLAFAVEINKRFQDNQRKIISFCGMHPDCDNVYQKLALAKQMGIKGIKIHPDFQGTFIDDERYINIIKIAKELDLIVVTHSGVDDGYKDFPIRCTPERALKVIKEVNYDKLVLAHFGAHRQWQETLDILAGENVYFDTAFTFNDIDKELFKQIVKKHGDSKILFATDSPWRDIDEDVKILKSFGLEKEVEDKILYKNALKLLNI